MHAGSAFTFSDIHHYIQSSRSSMQRMSQPQPAGPAAANRLDAPWSFLTYDPAMPVEQLLQRGAHLVQYVSQECHRGMLAASSPGRAVKDSDRNLLHVHATADLPGVSTWRVLRTLAGPSGTSFDDFLDRLLGDKLEGVTLHRNACADTYGRPWADSSRVPPRMVSVGSLYYDDSSLFKHATKELVYLDYMHIHSDERTITRVFKSVDCDPLAPKKHVERHKHILFGYSIEDITRRPCGGDADDEDSCTTRVTFYGDYAMALSEPGRVIRDAKHFLEKLATSIQLLERILAVHLPKLSAHSTNTHVRSCHTCLQTFSRIRSPTTCVGCTMCFCVDCLSPHEVADTPSTSSSSSGSRRSTWRTCHACYASSNPRRRFSQSSLRDAMSFATSSTPTHHNDTIVATPRTSLTTSRTKPTLQAPCAQCTVRPATLACRLCRDLCCQPCCRVERFVDPHGDVSFDVWTCTNCIAQTTAETSPPQAKSQPVATPIKTPPPHPSTQAKNEIASSRGPSDFIDPRPHTLLFNYLVRISEGNESDNLSSSPLELGPCEPSPPQSSSSPDAPPSADALPASMSSPPPQSLSNAPLSDQTKPHDPPMSPAHLDHIRTAAVLDLDTNDDLDALCLQTATRMECTYAFVNLIYKGAYMLKGVAAIGAAMPTSIPRDCALSSHSSSLPLLVPDAEMDARFAMSPLVTGKEHIRFYYGLPLVTTTGALLGTVAVADNHPRVRVSASQRDDLVEFASQTATLIATRLNLQ
ncbi:hypothetical protein H310_07244 [Aphanomyces invadans]|uniref:FYVE-type domain-containing protein n=1 Tax=Aphanomyces invadans TaxID=157072 RepID=A0A024U355_9STRA|nr:hypothetical protein H310_07244 [Aphanomyces invadans]ETW00684.1 hypothetical protein H310_07244 [Aphanomyces invadans]|eukprot:XP_008870819.1 hypothetical protein H310_07244 [Aphanomyces invadans]